MPGEAYRVRASAESGYLSCEGASWPVAASFASLAVSLARRSSLDRPAAEAVTSAGQVGVVNAGDGHEALGAVAEYGSWSCAGMRNGAFRRERGSGTARGGVGRPK